MSKSFRDFTLLSGFFSLSVPTYNSKIIISHISYKKLVYSCLNIENEIFFQDGYEWTRVYCTYEMKKDGEAISSYEIFLLRKDDAGCWKIYGWDLVVQ